jgi:ABC-type nitrate/sulfonate/bicarbonate transport system permease component
MIDLIKNYGLAMAVLSGGCTLAESAGGVLGLGFFLNKPVKLLNALSEALSTLFKALLVTVLDFVFAFVAAVDTACCGILFTD